MSPVLFADTLNVEASSASKWPPDGERTRVPVARDTLISSVGDERDGNNGGASRLKVKGNQEYALLDMDTSDIRGRIVKGALLHIRSASPHDAPLARIGVSSVASEWVEGSSHNYRSQRGSSSFSQAEFGKRDWAYSGSNFMDVVFSRGHTTWRFADCTSPDRSGWQTCAVDPDVISARISGISHGFALYDEVGNEWSINNNEFKYTYSPNRFFYSREKRRSAPWFELWLGKKDLVPPDPVGSIRIDTHQLPGGEAVVRWVTPRDKGGGKTIGFHVSYRREGEHEKTMPRYLIPMAANPDEEVKMHIQDLPFRPGENISLSIRPVDSAGNIGAAITSNAVLSPGFHMPHIPETDIDPFPASEELPSAGGLKVSVIDLLDKIDPRTGKMVPPHTKGYKSGNHIFSADKKLIRLQAARNETVSFQVNLEGTTEDKEAFLHYTFDNDPELKSEIYQFAYVNNMNDKGKITGLFQDPLVPLKGGFAIPSTSGKIRVPGQTNHSLVCELYVPHGSEPGMKKGKVIISSGSDTLEINVEMTVWDFTLPDKLSFVPEMNVYSSSLMKSGYEYYRLAHKHRTCINWLPYGWHGIPAMAPEWTGEGFEWSDWDEWAGPLLDGSAFSDLPRKNEPVDLFYLPLSENWPVSIFDHYRPSFWADEALSDQYKSELSGAFRSFAEHLDEKGWHDTIFQFYLNNKVYYRKNFRQSSAPWLFDEPVNTQDFWALRWYGNLWRSSIDKAGGNARMWFRGDISYSQFSRDILRGITDIEYLGENNTQKVRIKRDEELLWHGGAYFAEYGAANRIDSSNIQPAVWCISAWSKGAVGVLPWQTLGNDGSWENADQTSLFYPHQEGPVPSVRLKAFRRGQQDVEYAVLLGQVYEIPRYAISQWLQGNINVKSESVDKLSAADAGTAVFEDIDTIGLWKLRYRIGRALSAKAPEYQRAVVSLSEKARGMGPPIDIGYVPVAPKVESFKPECDSFRP